MLKMESRLAKSPMVISTQYPVMVIGGAEDKENGRDLLSVFLHSAGGGNAVIGIIPCASREPAVVGERYYQIFRSMGAKQVQILDIRYPNEGNEARWLDTFKECTGIFVTGGDQLRLCNLIGGTTLLQRIKEKVNQGQLVLAGTSAGAAMMGEAMIAGGSSGETPNQSLVDLTQGLGILPELLVDQHFHNRNRMARLMSAIAAYPEKLGVGIDEDTCAAVGNDGTFQILGKGSVTIIDPGSLTYTNHNEVEEETPLRLHNLKVHVLSQGDRYDYKNRTVLA